MSTQQPVFVTGRDGLRGRLESSAPDGEGPPQAIVRLDDGRRVRVPLSALVRMDDGSFFVPFGLRDVEAAEAANRARTETRSEQTGPAPEMQTEPAAEPPRPVQTAPLDEAQVTQATQATQVSSAVQAAPLGAQTQPAPQTRPLAAGERLVLPVIAEELRVDKRQVETGRVRIRKTVRERQQVVDEPLLREEVTVERVPVNRPVDGPVPVRYEGDTMIVPVLEEEYVLQKRLVLKEELRVTRARSTFREPVTVTLRSEEVTVERTGPSVADQTAVRETEHGEEEDTRQAA